VTNLAYKVEKFGDHRERRDFSKLKNKFELSNLLEVQKDSFQEFLDIGKISFIDRLTIKIKVYAIF